MAINFPFPASAGTKHTEAGLTWVYDGVKWTTESTPIDLPWTRDASTDTINPTTSGDDVTADNATFAGNIQSTSQNGGPLAGLRNLLINPFAQVDQRGDQTNFTDQRYCADRWRWDAQGNTISVYSLSPIALGAASDGLIDLTGQDYRQRLDVNSGTNGVSFDQRVEGVNTLILGQQYTESIYVRSTTAQNLAMGYRYRFGTGSTTSSQEYVGSTINVPANTWTRISHTFTAASRPATQDLKDDNATDIFVTEIQGFCEFSGWQLEPGPVATPLEHRPIAAELALCQRYYQIAKYNQVLPFANSSIVNDYKTSVNWITEMRVQPTVTGSNNQGTFNAAGLNPWGCNAGRSNTVANRQNSGSIIADAEL